jgi:hypothetical protein
MHRTAPWSVSRLATLTGVTVLALSGCTPGRGEDPSLLLDRVWFESQPAKPTDYVHVLFLLSYPSVGVFQRSSAYDFHFEQVDYKRSGESMKLTFPQTGKEDEVTFTVTACNALPPFDLCLDLSGNPWGGPKRYYAKRHQDDEDEAAARSMRSLAGKR